MFIFKPSSVVRLIPCLGPHFRFHCRQPLLTLKALHELETTARFPTGGTVPCGHTDALPSHGVRSSVTAELGNVGAATQIAWVCTLKAFGSAVGVGVLDSSGLSTSLSFSRSRERLQRGPLSLQPRVILRPSLSATAVQLPSVPWLLLLPSQDCPRRCGKAPGPHCSTCAPSLFLAIPAALLPRLPQPGQWRARWLLPCTPPLQMPTAVQITTPLSHRQPHWMMDCLCRSPSHSRSTPLRR